MMLRAADGLNNCEIAAAVGVTRQTVRTWRERFAKHRLDGLDDEPRCGAPRKIRRRPYRGDRDQDARNPPRRHALEHGGVAKCRAYRLRPCIAFGVRSRYSRIAPRHSSSRPTRSSSRKCATSSVSTSSRPTTRWSYASMKRPKYKPLINAAGAADAHGTSRRRTHDYDRHGTTTLFAGFIAAVTAETR